MQYKHKFTLGRYILKRKPSKWASKRFPKSTLELKRNFKAKERNEF